MHDHLDGATRLFPIIGDPVEHAKSPQRFSQGLAGRRVNALCVPMVVPEGALDDVMRGLARVPNIDGLLVTMPHKFTSFAYCATSSKRASLPRGVSVMRRNADGTWHGDMLDGLAFVKAQVDAGAKPHAARVLLIGAGAAGSAIAIALLEAGVRELVIHDTDAARVSQLLGILGELGAGRAKVGGPDPAGFDMVCNATPMGFTDSDPLPVAADRLEPSMFVGDVIARHGVTPLLKAAEAAGCKTANGTQMVEAVQEMMLDFMLNK
jgi:shikimate dehydrogenase